MLNQIVQDKNLQLRGAFLLIKKRNVKAVTKSVVPAMKEVWADFLGDKGGLYKEKIPELSHEGGVGFCRVVLSREGLPGRGLHGLRQASASMPTAGCGQRTGTEKVLSCGTWSYTPGQAIEEL